MAEQFYTILTNVGKAKIANSVLTGTKVDLTTLKIGDSNGVYYNPYEAQTDIVHKVYECAITSIDVDADNANWITITTPIPVDVGDFFIREVGAFDADGNLIAIGKYPETYKPIASNGATKELYLKMTLEVTNASSVELKIDPTIILATKNDIAILTNSVSLINSQMSEKANLIDFQKRDYRKFGKADMPDDFKDFGVNFFKDINGNWSHDFNEEQFKNITEVIWYVDPVNGNDDYWESDAGIISKPFKTINRAWIGINLRTETSYLIKVISRSNGDDALFGYYGASGSGDIFNLREGVNVTIIPNDNKRIRVTNAKLDAVWTSQGSGVYSMSTGSSTPINVTDYNYLDFCDMPTFYPRKSTLAEVQSTAGTWFNDGTTVYVHALDGTMPDNYNVFCQVSANLFHFNLTGGSKLAIYNCDIFNVSNMTNNNACEVNSTDGTGEFYNFNCKFSNAIPGFNFNDGDGLWCEGLNKGYSFNAISAYSNRDCFGYGGYTPTPYKSKFLEFKCVAYEAGTNNRGNVTDEVNNNAFTSHVQTKNMKVGCIGFNTYGPTCADAGKCISYLIDCHMYDAEGGTFTPAYQFYTTDGTGRSKATLIDCDGGGVATNFLEVYACDVYYRNVITNNPFTLYLDSTVTKLD